MSVAAVDIGTNSARLLIADDAGRELARSMKITRLGQGVDVTGRLAPEAMARTVAVLEQFGAECRRHQVRALRIVATSAARDADNSQSFFDEAEAALGARPELLSGVEEARLSFVGATAGLPESDAPFLVVDIGGGSTELALGTREPEQVASLQLGCRRMSERHLRTDPPTAAELEACLRDAEAALSTAQGVDVRRARRVLGLAGTVTALSALQLGLTRYDASRTHRSTLTLAQVEQSFHELGRATLEERRRLLAEPERADVIVGGAAVLLSLLRFFHLPELLVSEHDILDGLIAASLAA
jgi:exopolyphosphatase / guanosine-5'-triphosphate,3'-diphosphate pyrophosphatase